VMVVLLAHFHVCPERGCTVVGHTLAQVVFSVGLQMRSLGHEYRRIWAQVSHLAQGKSQGPFEGLRAQIPEKLPFPGLEPPFLASQHTTCASDPLRRQPVQGKPPWEDREGTPGQSRGVLGASS
jgi:hypothetical protein